MTEQEPTAGARIRASDAEREEYAKKVRDAVAAGRLSLDEGDERLARIYATKFRDELRPIVTDLPRDWAQAPEGGAQGEPQWRCGPMGRRRGFAGFALFPLVLAAVLITVWAVNGTAHFFWPVFPLFLIFFILVRRGMWWGWRRRWAAQNSRPRSDTSV
jgi:hypothetical protein